MEEQQEQFYQLLLSYSEVFASSSCDLGRTNKLTHSIDTKGAPPIWLPVRRLPSHQCQEVQTMLEDMLEKDVIHRSTSCWAAPIILVEKRRHNTVLR